MRISITENKRKHVIGVEFFNINYEMILKLLDRLDINKISIFIDNSISYQFYKTIDTPQLLNFTDMLNESFLIFDNVTTRCDIDKEIDLLATSKIMINTVLGENFTCVLINTNNVNITLKEVKEVFNR